MLKNVTKDETVQYVLAMLEEMLEGRCSWGLLVLPLPASVAVLWVGLAWLFCAGMPLVVLPAVLLRCCG